MGWRWAAMCLVLTSCIKAQLQPCGDLVCPADSVCLPDNTCVSHEALDVCVGKVDGDTCTTTLFTGSCASGVCTSPRCGDGVISGSEQCDGPVSGVDCVDYGFDTGVPLCSDRCGLDVVGSCSRFGWERVMQQPAYYLWTDGTRFAIATADRHRVEIYEGGQLTQSQQFSDEVVVSSLVGHGASIVATVYSRIVRSEASGPFTDVDLTGLPDGNYSVQVADDGSLYALILDQYQTVVFHQAPGGWQQILDSANHNTMLKWENGVLYVGYDNGEVTSYTGTSWSAPLFTLPDGPLDLIDRGGGVLDVTTASSGVYEIVNGTPAQIWDINYSHALPIGSDLYMAGDEPTVTRRIGAHLEAFDTPIIGDATTDGTNLYVFGNGIYRFTGMAYGQRTGISEPATDATLLADGSVAVASTTKVQTVDGPSTWSYHYPFGEQIAIAGTTDDSYYVASSDTLQYYDSVSFTEIALPAGDLALSDLAWRDDTGTLYVVGPGGLGMKRVGTTWTRFNDVTNCDLHALALRASDVYVVGGCGTEGVIWKLSGMTWTELHRTTFALSSLAVDASDNLYAAGAAGGVTRIAGAWQDQPRAKGISISATGPSDIWVGGGPDDVIHWDGAAWSRVRIVGAASPHVLATPRAVYIAGASTSVLVR